MKEYESMIQWIEEVPRYGHKDGLNNMIKLMAVLGNPQKGIPTVHVAGTNGKGSCCAMISRILTEAGYKTGRYTSPHLVDYRERITIGEKPISPEDFVRIGQKVRGAIETLVKKGEHHATYFEILTAIAFCWFAEQQADWIVLEVGVGGRLDATNIVTPRLCLITSISKDHTGALGNTLEAIAGEKAGILKKNVPVILSYNPPAVYTVIKDKAKERLCPFIYAGNVRMRVRYNDERGLCVNAETKEWAYRELKVNLRGDYQESNLAVVLEAVHELQRQGVRISEENLRVGLETVRWPGRMEYVPYQGHTLLLDGAHNGEAAVRLADYLRGRCAGGRCILVFSALEKKDVEAILKPLASCRTLETMIFTELKPEAQGMKGKDAAILWTRLGGPLPIMAAPDTETALRWAVQEDPELIVCAGSLYLIGEIQEILSKRP